MRNFIVGTDAFEELQSAKDWYTEISEKLGQAFFEDWKNLSESIRHNPFQSQIKTGYYRYAFFSRFPYVVVYEVSRNDIVIYRIVHASRHPRQRKKKK